MTRDAQAQPAGPSESGGRFGGLRLPSEPILAVLALALASSLAIGLADYAGVQGRGGVGDALRVTGAMVFLFGLLGFAPARLWLPPALKRHELVWTLPIGAACLALEMAVLAYAFVPFNFALALVIVGNLGFAFYAWRRDPTPPAGVAHGRASLRSQLVPLYLAMLIGAIALVPMFRGGFATVIGNGSDAHMAVGTAQLLQNHHPGDVAIEEPLDQVPFEWKSKPPIYLAFGAIASTAGLPPYAVIATIQAALLAMAAMGFWLMTRALLNADPWGAAMAMGLVGLDRMVLYTGMHPYFNQTWGYFGMPFAIVLAGLAVREEDRTRGGLALAAIFLAIVAFAYPLALPFPVFAALGFVLMRRRDQGLRLVPRPRMPQNRKHLWWMIPLALLALRPVIGVWQKFETALRVVAPWESLQSWGGDQLDFFAERLFFGISDAGVFTVLAPVLAFGLFWALRSASREVRAGLGFVVIGGVLAALFFRPREFGAYFHFKILAFTAPLLVATAAAGLSKFRRLWIGPLLLVVLLSAFRSGAADELGITFDQLPQHMLALQQIDDQLPHDESIRLDLQIDGRQFWIAYMLHKHPLCSQAPVLKTAYPHVPISRKADYILADRGRTVPFDAASATPVREVDGYKLYRQRADVPGPSHCSQRNVKEKVKYR